jgi:hypothetical protein
MPLRGFDFRPLVVLLIAGGPAAPAAQSPEPTFDVASTKRNVSGSFPVGPEARRGGSFVAINATVERLVRFAYDLPDYRLAGGPDWVRSDRFDVEARADRDASSEEIQRMVRTLLKDRFQLVIRQEQREGPSYALVFARSFHRPAGSARVEVGNGPRPDGSLCDRVRCPPGRELSVRWAPLLDARS